VTHFQDHSLSESFPNIKTALEYPYGEVNRLEGISYSITLVLYCPHQSATYTVKLITDADTDASDDYEDDVCGVNEDSEALYQSVVDPNVPLIEQE
jgi:hypothetical protein